MSASSSVTKWVLAGAAVLVAGYLLLGQGFIVSAYDNLLRGALGGLLVGLIALPFFLFNAWKNRRKQAANSAADTGEARDVPQQVGEKEVGGIRSKGFPSSWIGLAISAAAVLLLPSVLTFLTSSAVLLKDMEHPDGGRLCLYLTGFSTTRGTSLGVGIANGSFASLLDPSDGQPLDRIRRLQRLQKAEQISIACPTVVPQKHILNVPSS